MDYERYRGLFPDMPRASPAVDANGNMNHIWLLGFSNLFQALQVNFKPEGIMVPRLMQSDIDLIEASYAGYIGSPIPVGVEDISGQLVFDLTNRVSKQFVITYDVSAPFNILTAGWRTLQYV